MSAAALFTPGEGSYFVPHSERLDALPPTRRVAASEVWDAIIRNLHRGTTQTDDRITDRVLAQLLGRSRRFVQKGLKVLQDLEMIRRVRSFGRRIIVVLERFRGRDKPGNKAQPKATSPGTASMIPNVGIVRGATPEQVDAARARIADAAEAPEPTPEEIAAGQKFLEESRKRREAAQKARLRPVLVNAPRPDAPDAPGRTAQDALDARRRALGLPAAPPPDPAAGPPPRPDGPT